ncbi:GNAT family N-acetyltransferase [Pseudanabaena sp. PCC 6802]|uniref:GNAT family N-acetyltransferase n=1 Tax=Pseudanabaena sp. PCC 6802 TaxID=118173 RepID=UPI0004782858|nr:N-acetyltransferase [Pseudanabaena sp. PCC 6802]
MEVRVEKPEDVDAVRKVNIAAFGRESEANLVDRLRGSVSTLSFVAVESEQIIGHIFFSPVTIAGNCPDDLLVLGLAPLAVVPERQRQGVGSLLVRHGLNECAKLGSKAVVVLGHPEYYPRFGFVPAKKKGFGCEYAVPDEVFMLLELENGALEGYSGTVKYRPEFKECE